MAQVVVVGSINADLISRVAVHPTPGETVLGSDLVTLPGGKGANQAVAAACCGATVAMVGAIGNDEFSGPATSGLRKAGVDLRAVDQVPGSTGIAIITVSEAGENTIVVVPGANHEVTADRVAARADLIRNANVVVVQGEIPLPTVAETARIANSGPGRFLLNLAPVIPVDAATIRAARPLVVNEHEALGALKILSGAAGKSPDDYQEIARALVAAGVPEVIITLGGDGALVAQQGNDGVQLLPVPAPKVDPVDTTGAGDAFVGALAARLAAGDSLEDATKYAVRVGAFAVTGRGAQPSYPTLSDELPN